MPGPKRYKFPVIQTRRAEKLVPQILPPESIAALRIVKQQLETATEVPAVIDLVAAETATATSSIDTERQLPSPRLPIELHLVGPGQVPPEVLYQRESVNG